MQKVKSQNSEGGGKGAILTLGEGDGHGIFQFLSLFAKFPTSPDSYRIFVLDFCLNKSTVIDGTSSPVTAHHLKFNLKDQSPQYKGSEQKY